RPAPRLVEPTLTELAGSLALAQAYLGSDSGVSHLAASVGTPSVILYPAETLRRWAPWAPGALPIGVGAEGQIPGPPTWRCARRAGAGGGRSPRLRTSATSSPGPTAGCASSCARSASSPSSFAASGP